MAEGSREPSRTMPTLIGIFFLGLGLYCFTVRREWLFGVLVLAGFFEAASAINIGSRGVQPYHLIALLYIASRSKALLHGSGARFSGRRLLVGFVLVGCVSALLYPVLFAGTPVYSSSMSMDEGFLYHTPLQLSAANLIQAGTLVVNAAVVFAAASEPRTKATNSFIRFSFALLTCLILAQFAASFVGKEIPLGFIRNNPSYSISTDEWAGGRVFGTYTEPAGAGIALLLLYGGALYQFLLEGRAAFVLLISAISLGLVRSSSALVGAAGITFLLIAVHPPFRSGLRIRRRRLLRIGAIGGSAAVLLLSPLAGALAPYTTGKSDTLSYVFRLRADVYALELLRRTHGLGVGLGSNRPSSLLTSLLSTVGIVGAILFLLMVWRLAQNARGSDAWLRWAIFAFVVGKMVAGPDINEPQLWTAMALAVSCSMPWKAVPATAIQHSWTGWFKPSLPRRPAESAEPSLYT